MTAIVKRALRLAAMTVLLGLCIVALLLSAMWTVNRFPTELPRPSGRFAVGRTTLDWISADLPKAAAPMQDGQRELAAWIWYPSRTDSRKTADYLPPQWRDALNRSSGVLMSDFLTRDLARIRIHSVKNAPLAPDERQYPVVFLLPGSGALVAFYTTLAEDLASHGYIVVGLNAAHLTSVVVLAGHVVYRPAQYDPDSLPDSQAVVLARHLINAWSNDIAFAVGKLTALNQHDPSGRFTGRLDLQHIGVLGHSLGGATAANFCYRDPQCKAGIDLDGRLFGPVISRGLRQPFMFIFEPGGNNKGPVVAHIMRQVHSMYARLPPTTRLGISVAGANHFTFSDQMLVKDPILIWIMRHTGLSGLGGKNGLQITASYVSTFFDVYLKGKPKAHLNALARSFPEVTVW